MCVLVGAANVAWKIHSGLLGSVTMPVGRNVSVATNTAQRNVPSVLSKSGAPKRTAAQ